MPDNTLQTGSDTIATDELNIVNGVDVSASIPRIKSERVKVGYGTDGQLQDVSAATPLPVTPTTILATGAPARVAASASSVMVAASNAARRGLLVFNDANTTLYLKYGTTASSTSYTVQVIAGGYWEMPDPIYGGRLDGIWGGSPTGGCQVTELA